MKVLNSIIVFISVASVSMFSCKKGINLIDENNKWVYLDSTNSANIKFIHNYAGNTPQIPTAPNATTGPQVFIYANGAKLSGAPLSYAGVWPTQNVYANIPIGSTRFDIINARMNLAVVPNIPAFMAGDTLATFTATVDKGKFYSFYIGDTVPTVRVTVREDIFPVPDYQMYKIRVANMLMNPTDTITLYSRRQKTEVINNITHKNVSDWVQLPLPVVSDTLEVRRKGTTTAFLTFNSFSPVGLRMYTVVTRGKTGVTAKLPSVSIITNR